MRQDDINDREWRKPENWRAGPLGAYASKADDRAFVPKRHSALGVTPNLSTGTGLGFVIGVVAFVVLILWLANSTNDRPAAAPAANEQLTP